MRRALCVGIDQYRIEPLTGCVNDAERMKAVLEKHHDDSPNFDCKALKAPLGLRDDLVTRVILREHIQRLFKDPADVALFHFSGHGTVNDLGGFLVTQDASRYDEGVAMNDLLNALPFQIRARKCPRIQQYLANIFGKRVSVPHPEVQHLVPPKEKAFQVQRRESMIQPGHPLGHTVVVGVFGLERKLEQ